MFRKKSICQILLGPIPYIWFVVLKNRPKASKVMIGITPRGFDKEMLVDGVRRGREDE